MDKRNRDRGTIKWNAMMLTEHVTLLREWYAEDDIVPEPKLDEFDFEELAYQIQTAVQTKSIVRIQSWENGTVNSVEETIEKLPLNTDSVIVLSPQGNKKVYIPHIMKIHLYDV